MSDLPGWLLWLVVGALGVHLVFKHQIKNHRYRHLEAKLPKLRDREEHAAKIQVELERLKRNRFIAFAAVVALASYLAYQDGVRSQETRDAIVNEIEKLTGQEWCNLDGWPCIRVGGITSVSVTQAGDMEEACANVAFDRQVGHEGSNLYQSRYKSSRFCIPKRYGRYSIFEFESELHAFITRDLSR